MAGHRRHQEGGAQRRLPDVDYASPTLVFFVTICAASNRAPFTDSRLAQIVADQVERLRTHFGTRVFSWCLMPDHLHLLLQLDDSGRTLGEVIRSFKGYTTKQSWALGYRGQLWQNRFYDHILRNEEGARTVGEYMRQNPARKGLVSDVDDYRWSGMPDPL